MPAPKPRSKRGIGSGSKQPNVVEEGDGAPRGGGGMRLRDGAPEGPGQRLGLEGRWLLTW